MSSPAVASLLRADKSASSVEPPPQQGQQPQGIFSQHYWASFLQVQIDKFCLLGLFVFLQMHGASEWAKLVLGAYLYSIQARRFKQ